MDSSRAAGALRTHNTGFIGADRLPAAPSQQGKAVQAGGFFCIFFSERGQSWSNWEQPTASRLLPSSVSFVHHRAAARICRDRETFLERGQGLASMLPVLVRVKPAVTAKTQHAVASGPSVHELVVKQAVCSSYSTVGGLQQSILQAARGKESAWAHHWRVGASCAGAACPWPAHITVSLLRQKSCASHNRQRTQRPLFGQHLRSSRQHMLCQLAASC